jgi:hypothetical protein
MDRSEGTTLAVGALLVGVGAVILGLLAPTAAAVVGAICGVAGIYMVASVYTGWPTFRTATDRVFQPKLSEARAEYRRHINDDVVFLIRVENSGRDNLNNALVNVVVPDFVRSLKRSTADGDVGREEHRGVFSIEDERFWSGDVSFSGRMTTFIFFRASLPSLRDFAVRFKVFSPELDELFEAHLHIQPPPPKT